MVVVVVVGVGAVVVVGGGGGSVVSTGDGSATSTAGGPVVVVVSGAGAATASSVDGGVALGVVVSGSLVACTELTGTDVATTADASGCVATRASGCEASRAAGVDPDPHCALTRSMEKVIGSSPRLSKLTVPDKVSLLNPAATFAAEVELLS
ncbi:hypothetical protein CH267_24865 [Rhodococcus sp. 06-621-2]|nr:hypothetical protein CH267_24865 [Rhodococcus sp. 06-621-2]